MSKFNRIAALTMCLAAAISPLYGCKGEAGKSAYELAVEQGYEGTLDEWLDSLRGKDGMDAGGSAYDIAVSRGYTGTIDEWLAGLNGADGKDGVDAVDYVSAWYEQVKVEGYTGSFTDFLETYNATASAVGADMNAYAVSKAMLSSVTIYTRVKTRYNSPFGGTQIKTSYSAGAGVVFKDDKDAGTAYIITNYHVVYDSSSTSSDGIADYIGVCLYGMNVSLSSSDETAIEKSTIKAEFVGGSMDNDIAVIKITDSDKYRDSAYVPVTAANSDEIALGQTAIAIGNPEGLGFSATTGTVSVDSEYITMEGLSGGTMTVRVMRVDTGINGGNSGGGLYDGSGELVGIVNAKTSSSDIENISYAIPVNVALGVAENVLRNNGKFVKHALGITCTTGESSAVYDAAKNTVRIVQTLTVSEVDDNGAAAEKLEVGDKITAIAVKGKTITVTRSFQISDALLYADSGNPVTLTVIRGGETLNVAVNV